MSSWHSELWVLTIPNILSHGCGCNPPSVSTHRFPCFTWESWMPFPQALCSPFYLEGAMQKRAEIQRSARTVWLRNTFPKEAGCLEWLNLTRQENTLTHPMGKNPVLAKTWIGSAKRYFPHVPNLSGCLTSRFVVKQKEILKQTKFHRGKLPELRHNRYDLERLPGGALYVSLCTGRH